jgi:PAS domain S-box-containing protein
MPQVELQFVRQLLEAIPGPVFFKDSEGRYLGCNRAFEEYVGRSRAELIGRTVHELWTKELADVYLEADRKLLENPGAQVYEAKVRHADQGLRDVLFYKATFSDGNGGVGGLVGVMFDISERKRVQAALAESEARFRDFARATGDWFWETDAEGRITWMSEGIERAGSVPRQWFYGRRREELAAPGTDFSAEPWKSHLEALARREPFRDFRYFAAGPAARRWISVSGVPRFADGAFAGYRGVASEVTAQVSVETRAALADERLRAAIENLGESIAVTDAEDRIVVANRYFRELNGATGPLCAPGHRYEEHLRAGIPLGHYPEAAGREEEWLAARLAARRRGGTIEVQRQDGKWLQVTDQRLPDGGTITFALDITARKQMEAMLREMNAELERRVAERTAQLETAYRELESFSYSVSHDLRAPLRAISGFASILRDEEAVRLSGEGRRYLSVIDKNAQQMGRLIDALLALVSTSRHAPARAALDMRAIARAAAGELAAAHPRARVEIGALPVAIGDATLIRQVFANLVGNALKYSAHAGSPCVEIGAETGDASVYFVRDNGIGFDMAYAGKLFKPFERLHAEAEYAGTGIGLALVKLIVERHGGAIWAEAAPGRGATFRFTLGSPGPL